MESKNQQQQKVVYYIEDDKDDQDIFKSVLKEVDEHISLVIFDGGEEFLNSIKKTKSLPDVVFLDLYMPIIDGFSCLKELKNTPRYKDIPVIIYSSEFDKNKIDTVMKIGVNGYIIKPYNYKNLKSSLEGVFKELN